MTARQRVTLKPASDDLKVRNPDTGEHLRAEGETVVLTSYWVRRLRDGDVVKTDAPAKTEGPDADAILAVLSEMDVDNDDQWTGDGLPKMAHIETELGVNITRADVDAVAPDFTRETAAGSAD